LPSSQRMLDIIMDTIRAQALPDGVSIIGEEAAPRRATRRTTRRKAG